MDCLSTSSMVFPLFAPLLAPQTSPPPPAAPNQQISPSVPFSFSARAGNFRDPELWPVLSISGPLPRPNHAAAATVQYYKVPGRRAHACPFVTQSITGAAFPHHYCTRRLLCSCGAGDQRPPIAVLSISKASRNSALPRAASSRRQQYKVLSFLAACWARSQFAASFLLTLCRRGLVDLWTCG